MCEFFFVLIMYIIIIIIFQSAVVNALIDFLSIKGKGMYAHIGRPTCMYMYSVITFIRYVYR